MKKTRKDKKLRKTRGRGRRRTQRGGNVQQVCNEINAAKDIKTAETLYRKGALKFHPDKGGNEEDFKALGNCFDTKKKSLESGQASQSDDTPAPSTPTTTFDRTPKADLYVYFYRNGRPVKFADLTEDQQRSVRGAVLHLPETPLRIQEEGTFGIIKADVKFVNYVNSKKDGVENTLYGNETNAPPIILKLRANRMDGGRKSRR